MPQHTLEQRVAEIERQVADLRSLMTSTLRAKDWRQTVGMFADDEGMQRVFEEAMKIRERDRRKTRRKPARRERTAK